MPSIGFTYRAHEWLAKRVSWIQYPGVRIIPKMEREPMFRWKTEMPLWQRFFILCMSLLLLIVGTVFAVIVCNFLYLFVRALVSS